MRIRERKRHVHVGSSSGAAGIATLVLVAAIRVLMFAAFLFCNVDEQAHADLVLKFARGHWPARIEEHYDQDSARLIAFSGTWEYMKQPGQVVPIFEKPRWTLPTDVQEKVVDAQAAKWVGRVNHEALGSPFYYACAAVWYRIGTLFGLSGPSSLYFVRFLNAPVLAGAVVAAHRFCRLAFPERAEMRVGVPLLVAFIPQDVFYSINCDVLPHSDGRVAGSIPVVSRAERRPWCRAGRSFRRGGGPSRKVHKRLPLAVFAAAWKGWRALRSGTLPRF